MAKGNPFQLDVKKVNDLCLQHYCTPKTLKRDVDISFQVSYRLFNAAKKGRGTIAVRRATLYKFAQLFNVYPLELTVGSHEKEVSQ